MRSWAAWLVVVGCSNDGALIAGRYQTSGSCGPTTFDIVRATGVGSDELFVDGITLKVMGSDYNGEETQSYCGPSAAYTSLTTITLTATSSTTVHLERQSANVNTCDPNVIAAATRTCDTDASLVTAGPVIDSFEPDDDCIGATIHGSNFRPPVELTLDCCNVFTSMRDQSESEIHLTYVGHVNCHATTEIFLTNNDGLPTDYVYE